MGVVEALEVMESLSTAFSESSPLDRAPTKSTIRIDGPNSSKTQNKEKRTNETTPLVKLNCAMKFIQARRKNARVQVMPT